MESNSSSQDATQSQEALTISNEDEIKNVTVRVNSKANVNEPDSETKPEISATEQAVKPESTEQPETSKEVKDSESLADMLHQAMNQFTVRSRVERGETDLTTETSKRVEEGDTRRKTKKQAYPKVDYSLLFRLAKPLLMMLAIFVTLGLCSGVFAVSIMQFTPHTNVTLAQGLNIWGTPPEYKIDPCSKVIVTPVKFSINSVDIRNHGDGPLEIECTWPQQQSVFRLFNSMAAIPITMFGLAFLFKNMRVGLNFYPLLIVLVGAELIISVVLDANNVAKANETCKKGFAALIGAPDNSGSFQGVEINCQPSYFEATVILNAFAASMCLITGLTVFGFIRSYQTQTTSTFTK